MAFLRYFTHRLCTAIAFATIAVAVTTNTDVFARPVISRAYEQTQWTLRDKTGSGLRENASSVGDAIANLRPTYVSGLIYLESGTTITDAMVDDWDTIRKRVLAKNANVKFDVELSLNKDGKEPFSSPDALVAKMKYVNEKLSPDGFWFDFYSGASAAMVKAATDYAHSQQPRQTVGGNLFGDSVPEGADAFAFVDNSTASGDAGKEYGFDFKRAEIMKLKANAHGAVVLGHLQSNPQHGPIKTDESYVYTQMWNESKRLSYLTYWASQQKNIGFTFMYPVFYPLYPGAVSWDPLTDTGPNDTTLYEGIRALMSQYSSS